MVSEVGIKVMVLEEEGPVEIEVLPIGLDLIFSLREYVVPAWLNLA